MSENDREEALYVAKAMKPDEWVKATWDQIPADVQDTIDLSDYDTSKVEVLAKNDQMGRTNLTAITSLSAKDPKVKEIVDALLKALDMQSIGELTKSQSTALLVAIHKRDRGVTTSWDPNNMGNIDPNTQGKLGS